MAVGPVVVVEPLHEITARTPAAIAAASKGLGSSSDIPHSGPRVALLSSCSALIAGFWSRLDGAVLNLCHPINATRGPVTPGDGASQMLG